MHGALVHKFLRGLVGHTLFVVDHIVISLSQELKTVLVSAQFWWWVLSFSRGMFAWVGNSLHNSCKRTIDSTVITNAAFAGRFMFSQSGLYAGSKETLES